MAKRPQGDGTIYQNKDGRWQAQLSLGFDASGKRVRRSVYGKTQAECLKKLNALKRDRDERVATAAGGGTVGAYLKGWLKTKDLEVGPRTIDNYRRDVARYLAPLVGKKPLAKLSTRDVKLMQAALSKRHGAYTANRARALLHNALNDALREGFVRANPVAATKRAKHVKKRITIWSASEIAAALAEARRGRYYAFFFTALATGMRHGELNGLTWSRVKLFTPADSTDDWGEILVDQALEVVNGSLSLGIPKTSFSVRELGIDRDTKRVLEEHRERLACEAAVVKGYRESDLVFPSSQGTFLRQSNTLKVLKRIVEKSGVTPVSVHDLRHTHASMLIASGVDVVSISKRLGHASPDVTLRIYAHLFEKRSRPPAPSLHAMTGFAHPETAGPKSGPKKEEGALSKPQKSAP